MKKTKKKIVALIPCHNEEKGVGNVIDGFNDALKNTNDFVLESIVIDNNSTDKTAEVARRHGASVVHESKPGKGNAMQHGFASVPTDADFVVMIDGDDTYQARELLRLIEPLHSGFCNVVVGSRLAGKISSGAMSHFTRFGNWSFSLLVRYFYHANTTDVLTGYFAWKRSAVVRLRPHLTSRDFGIEMDMVTKMARLGESIYSVPITYAVRSGETNLYPIRDGLRILNVFIRNFFWHPDASYTVKVPRTSRHPARATV